MGNETPVGILATIPVLIALEQIDQCNNNQTDPLAVIYCASGALMQALGLMIERLRTENQPMHVIGRELAVPDWVINLRHRLAHGPGETNLQSLEEALDIVLDSLLTNEKSYWVSQYKIYDKEIKLKSRKLSTDEKRGLFNLLNQMSNDLESRKIIEQVREICSELAYRNYFIQIAVQHLIKISDTNIMNNWARTLQQLDWILEFANQFSRLYKLNFEGKRLYT